MTAAARILGGTIFLATPVAMIVFGDSFEAFVASWLGGSVLAGSLAAYLDWRSI